MASWVDALSNPQGVRAIYGGVLPVLEEVKIHEICMSMDGPVVKIKFDLPGFPKNPPEKWRRDNLNTVQFEISFIGVSEVSVVRFSENPICSLSIRKKGVVYFGGESESVEFSGVAEAVAVLRISAYLDE
ncbi:Imm50 family immunity protein [Nocardiopsis sp. ATB16-24]|uniref:Imm50 family immunity protein n=1 Tax=Nocardiopsis sp. ATB16-24 TaxID=3019555 RepID=UPI0025569428|nr:Imm50 family immunity protein [Nocardiopsis sp. ATB16-24]